MDLWDSSWADLVGTVPDLGQQAGPWFHEALLGLTVD